MEQFQPEQPPVEQVEQAQQPRLTTIDGGTDFSGLQPGDPVVSHGLRTGRSIIIDAGIGLTAERTPVSEAPDGATERLDRNYVTKLGGRVLGVSVPNEHLRK